VTTYRRHPDLRLTELEGEGVVLHLGSRRYFTVSESGLTILTKLEDGCTFDALVAALLDEYEVSHDEAAESVKEFLDRCMAADLLVLED
jgi:L-asparaginase II